MNPNNQAQRTFENLETYAAEIFTNDPKIKNLVETDQYPFPYPYTAESWTKEFMEYGCYCNRILRGGGRLPTNDIHEKACIGKWFKYNFIYKKVGDRRPVPIA